MLNVSKITSSDDAVNYYAKYALEQGEAQGQWHGLAAPAFNLEGKNVTEKDLKSILEANHPQTGNSLIKWRPDNRIAGYDFTFSAPKSVSVIWSSASPELRSKIEEAHKQAIKDAMEYTQDHIMTTRRGKGGKEVIPAGFLMGLFQHSSNREKEPQLHSHAIIPNVAIASDGIWRSINAKHFLKRSSQDQKAISSVYKLSLDDRMRKMGFSTERTKHSFEIKGVSKKVIESQSSRSKAIEDELAAYGVTRETASRELKEAVTLKTRKEKTKRHHAEVANDFDRWQKENGDMGFTQSSIDRLQSERKARKVRPIVDLVLSKIGHKAMDEITNSFSVFDNPSLHAKIGEELIGKGSYADFKRAGHMARKDSRIEYLATVDGREKLSTNEMIRTESNVFHSINSRQREALHAIPREQLDTVIKENYPTITQEQKNALEAATQSISGVTIIQGVAGAGKSYAMAATKTAFESQGFSVMGLAPTNKAARVLSASTEGMDADTIHSLLFKVKEGKIRLNKKNVLIVDEAGMIGSRKLEELLKLAEKAKAKVIMLGDSKQIQPIEAGQIFGEMHRRFSKTVLHTVMRQEKEEATALLKFRDSTDPEVLHTSIKYLEDKGLFTMKEFADEAIGQLTQDFIKHRRENPNDVLVAVASKNDSVARINKILRDDLVQSGGITDSRTIKLGKGKTIDLGLGDIVTFNNSQKRKGIYRSDLAKVTKISGKKLTLIRQSDEKEIVVDLSKFTEIQHGYGITAHKSQASTVDRAFVYSDGPFMDKEKIYVAMTRGRKDNSLYADTASLGKLDWKHYEMTKGFSKEQREAVFYEEFKKRLVFRINTSSEKSTTLKYIDPKAPVKERTIVDIAKDRLGQASQLFTDISEKLKTIKIPEKARGKSKEVDRGSGIEF